MSNTYTDNPARGLSKLQKAILTWIRERYEHYEQAAAYMVTGEDAPGIPWGYRPTFYGRPLNLFGGKSRYWYAEAPAVSRALKRLEERLLVTCSRSRGGRVYGVKLTHVGRHVADDLLEAGHTHEYKDKRPEALAALHNLGKTVKSQELTVLETEHERENGD